LKPILIVGNIDFILREWNTLQNMPLVHVFNGSLLSRDDLIEINGMVCDMCIILSSNKLSTEEITFVDKEALLASINVKTVTFEDSMLGVIGLNTSKSETNSTSIDAKVRK